MIERPKERVNASKTETEMEGNRQWEGGRERVRDTWLEGRIMH